MQIDKNRLAAWLAVAKKWTAVVEGALDTVPVRWVLLAGLASNGALASFDGGWWWRGPLFALTLPVLGYAVVRLSRERRKRRDR